MKIVKLHNNREYEVPTDWAEGEEMITASMKYHEDRGRNLALMSTAARVVYGMFGEQMLAADPTQALMYLVQRICEREGCGLDK